jgi:hypothetical protein
LPETVDILFCFSRFPKKALCNRRKMGKIAETREVFGGACMNREAYREHLLGRSLVWANLVILFI